MSLIAQALVVVIGELVCLPEVVRRINDLVDAERELPGLNYTEEGSNLARR